MIRLLDLTLSRTTSKAVSAKNGQDQPDRPRLNHREFQIPLRVEERERVLQPEPGNQQQLTLMPVPEMVPRLPSKHMSVVQFAFEKIA